MTDDTCFAHSNHFIPSCHFWYNYNPKLTVDNNIVEFLSQICHIACAASVRPAQLREDYNIPHISQPIEFPKSM